MFERFTDRARRVLVLAQDEARVFGHGAIGTEHLLLGLRHEDEGVAATALELLGVTLDAVREQVEKIVGRGEFPPESPPFTPRSKKVLELSLREALQLGHNYIGTEHLLLALVLEGDGVGARVLEQVLGDDALARVRAAVLDLLGAAAHGETLTMPGPFGVLRSKRPNPPLCPHCGARLDQNARATRLAVEDDAGGPAVPTTMIYCSACGYALVSHLDTGPTDPPVA